MIGESPKESRSFERCFGVFVLDVFTSDDGVIASKGNAVGVVQSVAMGDADHFGRLTGGDVH